MLARRGLRKEAPRLPWLTACAVLSGLAGYLVQGQFLFEHVVSLMFLAVAVGLAGCPAVQTPAASESGCEKLGARGSCRADGGGGEHAKGSAGASRSPSNIRLQRRTV